jgi:hypothetical protein
MVLPIFSHGHGGLARRSRNQKNIHHRETETRRKTKSKPEGTEVAENTEGYRPRSIGVSVASVRENPRGWRRFWPVAVQRNALEQSLESTEYAEGTEVAENTEGYRPRGIGVSAASVRENRRGWRRFWPSAVQRNGQEQSLESTEYAEGTEESRRR